MWPPHYNAIGEKINPSFTHHARLFYNEFSYVRLYDDPGANFGRRRIWGHMTSSEATNRFGLITNDWKELETWAWYHCACIVTTHRLICIMTYLGQHLTSGDLALRSNIDLTFLRSACIWFLAPRLEEHADTQIKAIAFLVQRLFEKKTILAKNYFGVLWSLARKQLT